MKYILVDITDKFLAMYATHNCYILLPIIVSANYIIKPTNEFVSTCTLHARLSSLYLMTPICLIDALATYIKGESPSSEDSN